MIKVGDPLEVKMEDFVVATGVVTEISEGKVFIDIPATRVVMGLKTSLGDLEVEAPQSESQIIGTIEPDGTTAEVKAPTPVAVPAHNEAISPASTPVAAPVPEPAESLRNMQFNTDVLDREAV